MLCKVPLLSLRARESPPSCPTRDNTKRADGYTCTPGGVAYFSGFFPGEITVDACAWYPYRCLSTVIVQPDW
jgi:hypothetical protein